MNNRGDKTMDVRKMIARIEGTHKLMEAQADRLVALSPELNIQNLGMAHDSANGSELLNAVVFSQFQGAAKALRALAEVEVDFHSGTKGKQPVATAEQSTPETIDAEFRTIDRKEEGNGEHK